jgi:hypothetical protein
MFFFDIIFKNINCSIIANNMQEIISFFIIDSIQLNLSEHFSNPSSHFSKDKKYNKYIKENTKKIIKYFIDFRSIVG